MVITCLRTMNGLIFSSNEGCEILEYEGKGFNVYQFGEQTFIPYHNVATVTYVKT